MSLVNNMLRDLDRRGAGRPGDPETDSGSPRGNAHQGHNAHSRVWLWLLLGVLLGAGGLGLIGFWSPSAFNQESHQEQPVAGIAASSPVFEAGSAASQVDGLAPQASAKTEPKTEKLEQALEPSQTARLVAPEPSLAHNQVGTISRLLKQAEQARSRDRLTRPVGDNAYDYYQQVLALEPEHREARSGLAAIARRYTEMAETLLDAGKLSQARKLIRRGLSVVPRHPGLHQSQERLAGLVAAQQDESPTRDQSAGETSENSEAKEQAASAPEPQMQMNLDAETRDRRAAKRGRELLAAGNLAAARQHLQTSLRAWGAGETPPVQTTRALVDLYLREGNYASAERLLQASQNLPKILLHRLWAQLEQARGRPKAAIEWLESELASAREDEHYRSLLARLYYSQGQQEQAAQSYSRLLADFGGRPAYWLGLGLVRDAQDQDPEALEALRRAQASGAYARNPEIADYLKRRIAALQRQTQASEP